MPSPLVCTESPPVMIYVPSWVACPDSEPEELEELELNSADEGVASGQPNFSGENTVPMCMTSPENDGTELDCPNPGGHETVVLTYPDLSEESTTGPDEPDNYIGFSDGNIHLLVGTQPFLLHEHRLQEFSAFKQVIKDARQNESEPSISRRPRSKLELSLDEDPEDFANMVKILYLPIYESISPSNYTDKVFKSTLRLSTRLGHETLRPYAIQYLEKRNIPAIERIALANELHISSWRKDALNELSTRDQPITLEEANALGMETFAELARRRQDYILNAEFKAPPSNRPDRPQQDSLNRQPPTPRTPRRSARINARKCRVDPCGKHRVSSR